MVKLVEEREGCGYYFFREKGVVTVQERRRGERESDVEAREGDGWLPLRVYDFVLQIFIVSSSSSLSNFQISSTLFFSSLLKCSFLLSSFVLSPSISFFLSFLISPSSVSSILLVSVMHGFLL